MSYVFRQPFTAGEYEQLFRLNHRVFVEELQQYPPSPDGRLIDKFHQRNIYFAAFSGELLVGMIAVHDQPPFSIEQRLCDPALLAQLEAPLLEVRLLAIEPEHRNGMVVAGLFANVYGWARDRNFRTLLMSGLESRASLYRKLGFRELGAAKPYGNASFVPMALRFCDVPDQLVRHAARIRFASARP